MSRTPATPAPSIPGTPGPATTPDTAEPTGLAVYWELLRIPHAARSLISGVIGQFPFPFLGMGLLISIRDGYGNYTLAGTVSAVMALTSAVTGPVVGRLIDTHGQRRVGLPLSAFWVASIVFMGSAIHFHWAPWVMIAAAVCLGTSVPYSSMIRGRWTYVLRERPGRLNSALSLTSTMEELMWVIGNPMGTILATSVSMLSPLVGTVIAILIAGAGFLMDRQMEPPLPARSPSMADDAARLDPDASPQAAAGSAVRPRLLTVGFVSLMAIQVAYGAFIAATNISVVALAQEVGMPGHSGLVIAAFSGASMIGAVGYGARAWTTPLWVRFYVGMAIVSIGSSLLLLSHSLAASAAILFVAGLAQAPTVVNVNQLLIRMTPPARFTEAMAMLGAMFVVGMAVSNMVTGRSVDAAGSHGGFLTLAAFAGGALLIGLVSMRPIRKGTAVHEIYDVESLLGEDQN